MALLFDSDRLEHSIGVGIAGRPLVAVGDLDLLGLFHPGDDHLHGSEARLQALERRQLHRRRIGHRLAELTQALFDALSVRGLSVGDGADDLGAARVTHALRQDEIRRAGLDLAMPCLEQARNSVVG